MIGRAELRKASKSEMLGIQFSIAPMWMERFVPENDYDIGL
jgi:hypothetical protein